MATVGQDDRYRIRRRLASGGMAEVTLAEDTVLGRPVALKRLRAGGDRGAVARLRREALVGASLSHPNLVSVYDVWEEGDGELVIVMEYVDGDTLRDLIRTQGALPASRALPILAGVAAALDAVHEHGVVHRDVKPANILVARDGRVKLADLGIASVEDNTQITTSGEVVGTFRYMAPEQLEGQHSAPAIDIYALAAVAFEALSGEKARGEPNPLALAHAIATQPPPDLRALVPDVPAAAATVLERGMAPDPSRRPRSASELVGRLRAALDPQTTKADAVAEIAAAAAIQTPPPIVTAPTFERGRRRPGALAWALLSMLTLLAGAVVAIVLVTTSGSDAHRPGGAQSRSQADARSTASRDPAPPSKHTASPGATSTPAATVETFYERAAHHDYAGAWALADDSMRGELGGYASFHAQMSRVRSITFHEARTVSAAGASPATVTLRTTSALADRTENCSGTARVVRGAPDGPAWILDRISIACTPAG